MKKRILVLCSSFYPRGTASSHRVAKTAKYLREFGWEPVIICPGFNSMNDPWYEDSALLDKDPCEVIRVPYLADNRKKPQKAWLSVSSRLIPHLAPVQLRRDMEKQAEATLRERSFDVIMASSPSMMPLAIARRLSERFALPFVPDLRDIADELSDHPTCFVRNRVRIETSILSAANVLVTTSEGLAERLASRHRMPVHVVYNGYDPDDFAPATDAGASGTFDIVYCGGLTRGRKPSLLFEALDRMLDRNGHALDGVRVCFYGVHERTLLELIRGHRCRSVIHVLGRVSHAESIRVQQKATLLLLFSHREGAGPMPSKVFEYLGARRPVLSIPGDVRISDTVLLNTQAGRIGGTCDQIMEILQTWLEEWKRTGQVQYRGRPEKIEQYTRRNQVAQLAKILDEVVECAPHSSIEPKDTQKW